MATFRLWTPATYSGLRPIRGRELAHGAAPCRGQARHSPHSQLYLESRILKSMDRSARDWTMDRLTRCSVHELHRLESATGPGLVLPDLLCQTTAALLMYRLV